MNTRTVVGTIMRPDGTPWADVRVKFTLRPGSQVAAAAPDDAMVFPTARVFTAKTAADGSFSIELWCNDEGDLSSEYAVEMPSGEVHYFILPVGDLTDIDITTLITLYAGPSDPNYVALAAYVDAEIVVEAAARAAADVVLQSNIDAEAVTRASAVSAEAVTRAAADVVLQSNLDAHVQAVNRGGTNITSYAVGDLLYASGVTALAKLPKGTARQLLQMNAGATAPEWTDAASVATIGVGQENPLAPVHVGAQNTNRSSDSVILISRVVDDAVAGNGHAFSDSSQITRSGVIAYNSFDARVTITGANNYDHYAGFQSAPLFFTTGVTANFYGFTTAPQITAGAITNAFHYYVAEFLAGAGAVANNYGLYVEDLTKGGTSNYAVYTAGSTPSHFGGAVNIVGVITGNLTGAVTGNASTATALQTARNINGVAFNGTADITVTAAAATLTGATLAANVLASSLTSLGIIASLVATTADINGGTIDATAIGGATPAAGAFTTLAAAGSVTVNAAGVGSLLRAVDSATYAVATFNAVNGGVTAYVGADKANTLMTGSATGDLILRAENKSILFSADQGTTRHLSISATGAVAIASTLAVTGLARVGGSTPASAAAAGTAGTITWDASFIYVCVATNTWERAALATW